MKVKIPKNIRVGSLTGRVEFKENLKVDDGWRGDYNQRTGILSIDPQCGEGINATFLHEVIHLIDLNYECDLNEVNISRIANGVYEFLKYNLGIEFDWSEIETATHR